MMMMGQLNGAFVCVPIKLAVPQEGPPVLQPTNIVYHSKDYNNEGLRKFKIDHRSIDNSYTCTSSMRIWYHFTATCQQHTHTCLIIAIIIFMHTYPPSIDIRHTHTHTHTHTYDTALVILLQSALSPRVPTCTNNRKSH